MITFKYNNFDYIIESALTLDRMPLLTIRSNKFPGIPESLYHYYRIDRYGVDSLIKNYIYANHPFEFNDLFDCNRELISFEKATIDEILTLNRNPSKVEFIRQLYYSKKQIDRVHLHDILKQLVYNVIYMKTGIFCLTPLINNVIMWSYYTNHQGFAIEYDLAKIPSNHWGPFPINYTNKFTPIDYSVLKALSFLYQSNIKSKSWKHENEWRIIFYGPDVMTIPFKKIPNAHDRKFPYNQDTVKQIILGFSFFDIVEYTQKDFSDNYSIKLKKNKTLKRQILNYLISNEIKTSLVHFKRKSSFKIGFRPVKISMISPDKYEMKYVG